MDHVIMNDFLLNDDNSDEDELEDFIEEAVMRNNPGQIDVINVGMRRPRMNNNVNDFLFGRERGNGVVVNFYYYDVVIPSFDDKTFHSHFRMTRATYIELENTIRPRIRNLANNGIPLRKKILLTLWIIANPDTFRSVAEIFGLVKSDAYDAFKEIVTVLKELLSVFVTWPNPEECEDIARVFQIRSRGFPNIVGAIDGTHIPIKQPPGNVNDYYNRKGHHSIILQATCDHKGKFIDCLIGRPGRAHDASVFRSSPLYGRMTDPENPLLPSRQHLLGDCAYPLMKNLLTPFRDNGHLSALQTAYNVKLSSVRSITARSNEPAEGGLV